MLVGFVLKQRYRPTNQKAGLSFFTTRSTGVFFTVQEHECVVRPVMHTDRYCELSSFRAGSGEVNIHIIQMGTVREFIRVRGSRIQARMTPTAHPHAL